MIGEGIARAGIDLAHKRVVHPYLTRGEAQTDREKAHERALDLMKQAQGNELIMSLLHGLFVYKNPILQTNFAGVEAPNPLGLAAGFDKNARVYRLLGAMGFGFVTVGSITEVPYEGNARPRIFDLPDSDSLINRMGFPGDGANQAEAHLRRSFADHRKFALIVNTAASKPSFDRGTPISDYTKTYRQLYPYGEISEINVSSPNTPGVKGLQEPEMFNELAQEIALARTRLSPKGKPTIYKFGPDLPKEKLLQNLKTVLRTGGNGVCLTNTTVDVTIRSKLRPDLHRQEVGGMSGACLTSRALEVSHMAWEYTEGKLPIKRAGGIGSPRDLWNALTYGGATTVDIYSAFVRPTTSTPNLTMYWLKDLAKAMQMEGMTSMKDFAQLKGQRVRFPLY